MTLYLDTAWLAKCYWNEPDGATVRALARQADGLFSSAICIAEMACVAHRKLREGQATASEAAVRRDHFLDDVATGVITIIPVTDRLLRRVETVTRELPPECFLRACDALHLVTAVDAGFTEIGTNDRHMLAAAPYFGLTGKTLPSST